MDHGSDILSLSVGSNGNVLSGGTNGIVKLWSQLEGRGQGQLLAELSGLNQPTSAVNIGPNNRHGQYISRYIHWCSILTFFSILLNWFCIFVKKCHDILMVLFGSKKITAIYCWCCAVWKEENNISLILCWNEYWDINFVDIVLSIDNFLSSVMVLCWYDVGPTSYQHMAADFQFSLIFDFHFYYPKVNFSSIWAL